MLDVPNAVMIVHVNGVDEEMLESLLVHALDIAVMVSDVEMLLAHNRVHWLEFWILVRVVQFFTILSHVVLNNKTGHRLMLINQPMESECRKSTSSFLSVKYLVSSVSCFSNTFLT